MQMTRSKWFLPAFSLALGFVMKLDLDQSKDQLNEALAKDPAVMRFFAENARPLRRDEVTPRFGNKIPKEEN